MRVPKSGRPKVGFAGVHILEREGLSERLRIRRSAEAVPEDNERRSRHGFGMAEDDRHPGGREHLDSRHGLL